MLNRKLQRWILAAFFCLVLVSNSAYGLDMDRVKASFLSGDYKAAVSEGEKVLAKSAAHSPGLDELYYFLGLSYLKEGNYLRASDIFEIIIREFKDSRYRDEAGLSLGDAYFLKGDYKKAQTYYSTLMSNGPDEKLKAMLYYRLSQAAFKKGETQQAKEYLDKLKKDFPSSPEMNLERELAVGGDIFYTVQVGAFANFANARNLRDKLINSGYGAYIEEAHTSGKKAYRVRVGRLKTRQEAVGLENNLILQGYPTKIFP